MKNPLISIIIPCYNSDPFLTETLESCFALSWPELEIILIDDGSTDRSVEIARKFAETHTNITVLRQKRQGACVARNRGLEVARGEYIQFLDADDLISPNKLSEQIQLLTNYGHSAIAMCRWQRFTNHLDDGIPEQSHVFHNYTQGFELLLDLWEYGEMISPHSWLCHRQLLKQVGTWNTQLHKNQDGEYFGRVLLQASDVLFAPEAMVYYRSNIAGSVSCDDSVQKAESLLTSFDIFHEIALAREDSPRVRHALGVNYVLFLYLFGGVYPQLAISARQSLMELGCDWPLVGGAKFQRLAKLIGIRRALKIKETLKYFF